jgi:hypothetical protein
MGFLGRASGRQIYFEHYAGRGPAVVQAALFDLLRKCLR